jgi:hypothetical protein
MLILAEVNPYWWAQPVGTLGAGLLAGGATLLAATIVFRGVKRTLQQNREESRRDRQHDQAKARTEHLLDGAKARAKSLQESYSSFAKAGLSRIGAVTLIHRLAEAIDDPKVAHLHEFNKSRMTRTQDMATATFEELGQAYCRLLLIESSDTRLARLKDLYKVLSEGGVDGLYKHRVAIGVQIVEFVRQIAIDLVQEYQRDAELAEKGIYPPIIITPPPATMKATVEGPVS